MQAIKSKIKRITPIGQVTDWVYDLTMDHPTQQWFFANNILVHNSTYFATLHGQDISNQTHEETLNQAIKRADEVAEEVNRSYPAFMESTFLCGPEYRNSVKCSREVVAPAGIFVTPKRYVLWLEDLDGKRVDKLKVMGLDTKKTILPRYIQVALNGFVERYLKGADWHQLAEDIVDYKRSLKNRDISDLGLPKGVNNLEAYQQEYNLYGDAVRLPGHVRASILYNKMLDDNNDNQTMRISSGMKVKVYYLRRHIGKFKSIAFPVDEDRVPDWFRAVDVDIDLQIEKLVDNPLQNILKAIGKIVPTPQTLFVDSFLEF